jgi:hypothetical protein
VKRNLYILSLVIGLLFSTVPVSDAQRAKPRKSGQDPASMPFGNVEGITEAQLKNYLYYVASDEMEGRDTPSKGLDLTAKFIAMNLSSWGFKPLGEGSNHLEKFYQRIVLRRGQPDAEKTRATFNGQELKYGDDFTAQMNPGSASGELVYAGHGWVFPAKNINPYQGLQVKDKIVVITTANQFTLPRGVTRADLSAGKEGVDWESPLGIEQKGYLEKNGAKGVIIVPSAMSNAGRGGRSRGPSWAVKRFQREAGLPAIIPTEKVLTAIFEGESRDGAAILKGAASNEPGESFTLNVAKKIRFEVGIKFEETNTQNVVGVLEGSDPKLKDEYIAIGAHYDHVGIGTPVNGDAIYNGADDDGSGTVAVLSIAEAFAKGPRPKRSLLFVWHAGEEKGLLGSRYVTDFPVVPLDRVVAQLNIDMIGRSKQVGDTEPRNKELSGPDEIYVIGSKMMSTDLGEVSESVNSSFLKLSFNYKYDDPKDPNRFFFRSDHFNYARKGIPIIFYFDGVHVDYHRPSDHPDKIDYRKMERVARTVLATGWTLANRPTRPVVDKKLPAELMAN